jgi:hypothetical protein
MSANKLGIATLLAIGFTSGYLAKSYQKTQADNFTIQADKISYNGQLTRPITIQKNAIQVGTLKDRLEDLLYENPYLIKQTIEQLYGEIKAPTKNINEIQTQTYTPTPTNPNKKTTLETLKSYIPFWD